MDNINTIIKALHDEGVITTEQVTIIALVGNGFSIDEARYIAANLNTGNKGEKRAYRRWTDEEKDTLRRLYESGVPRKEIAATLGRSDKQIGGVIGQMRLRRPQAASV